MNPHYTEFKFPQIKPHPWGRVFRPRTPPEAIDLVGRLLGYTPESRLSPLQSCAHTFFDELRQPGTKLSNNRELPQLFNFTEQGAPFFLVTLSCHARVTSSRCRSWFQSQQLKNVNKLLFKIKRFLVLPDYGSHIPHS